MKENEPFDELPLQYFPKPEVGHRLPTFLYGFSIDGASGIERLAHATGILKPEEALTSRNLYRTVVGIPKHLEAECGLSRKEYLWITDCCSETDASHVLRLKTSYSPWLVAPEKLEHVVRVLGRYFPGKAAQWFIDSGIWDMEDQEFRSHVRRPVHRWEVLIDRISRTSRTSGEALGCAAVRPRGGMGRYGMNYFLYEPSSIVRVWDDIRP